MFNKVSGTTGLTGSRMLPSFLSWSPAARIQQTLYAIGRDIEYQELSLRVQNCEWLLIDRKWKEEIAKAAVPDILFRLVTFLQDKSERHGSATELLEAIEETEITPNVITKLLNEHHASFLCENHISYSYLRKKTGRLIVLTRGDSDDSGDSNFGTAQNYDEAVTPP